MGEYKNLNRVHFGGDQVMGGNAEECVVEVD